MDFVGRNVILRITKPYQQARNHIYTGKVLARDDRFVLMDGCVFHFGRPSAEDPAGGLTVSRRAQRWVPIDRIQYLRELPPAVDPFRPELFRITADGNIESGAGRPDLLPE